MAEDADGIQEQCAQLRLLAKTDTDPREQRWVQGPLVAVEWAALAGAARLFHTFALYIRVWQTRFAEEGRAWL